MTKILISNVMFYGFHGVYEYEREQGQKFFYDVEMVSSSEEAADSDNVESAIDYIAVYQLTRELVEVRRFNLLEGLAAYMGDEILKTYECIREVTVKIRKPSVLVTGPIDYIEVSVTRTKK